MHPFSQAIGLPLFLAFLALGLAHRPCAGASAPNPLVLEAEAAFQKGRKTEAIALLSKVIATNGNDANAFARRGHFHSESRQPAQAIADFNQVLKLQPEATGIYQARGVEHFRLGQFKESVADFDEVIKRAPERGPHHWQRGISCYYAGMFAEGRQQFESHQTVNPRDVENAVWHFLCVARASGLKEARAKLIPISGDSRIPMKEVHQLFAGTAKPEDVLAAVAVPALGTGRSRENQPLFYAHLYLGLYYEAIGDGDGARQHITKAADDFTADHYMGDVARVHAQLLRGKASGRK